jgi:type IV secretion system protein VirD4
MSGRNSAMEMHDLLTPDEVSRHFSRSDRLKRQLVIWAGYDPMVLQRVEYFDMAGPHRGVFKGTFEAA